MRKNNERKPSELGSDSAGQSGDIQQISNIADAGSESVEELVEEGNAFEADAVSGVESAKDADVSESLRAKYQRTMYPPNIATERTSRQRSRMISKGLRRLA